MTRLLHGLAETLKSGGRLQDRGARHIAALALDFENQAPWQSWLIALWAVTRLTEKHCMRPLSEGIRSKIAYAPSRMRAQRLLDLSMERRGQGR